jgi:hypothetical protein
MIGKNHREDGATLVIPTENGVSAQAVDMWVHTALRGPARPSAALVTHELLARAKNVRSAPDVVRLTLVDRHRTLAVAVDDCAVESTGPRALAPAAPQQQGGDAEDAPVQPDRPNRIDDVATPGRSNSPNYFLPGHRGTDQRASVDVKRS